MEKILRKLRRNRGGETGMRLQGVHERSRARRRFRAPPRHLRAPAPHPRNREARAGTIHRPGAAGRRSRDLHPRQARQPAGGAGLRRRSVRRREKMAARQHPRQRRRNPMQRRPEDEHPLFPPHQRLRRAGGIPHQPVQIRRSRRRQGEFPRSALRRRPRVLVPHHGTDDFRRTEGQNALRHFRRGKSRTRRRNLHRSRLARAPGAHS